jgi:hypothetical protein
VLAVLAVEVAAVAAVAQQEQETYLARVVLAVQDMWRFIHGKAICNY